MVDESLVPPQDLIQYESFKWLTSHERDGLPWYLLQDKWLPSAEGLHEEALALHALSDLLDHWGFGSSWAMQPAWGWIEVLCIIKVGEEQSPGSIE